MCKEDKPEEVLKTSKMNKNKVELIIYAVGFIVVLGLGFLFGSYLKSGLGNDTLKDITLEEFSELPQKDIIVVDQGILKHDEKLNIFVEEHKGSLGVHTYTNEENKETYALISGEDGMEPLTIMLYGLVEDKGNHIVIGYNFVESSPQFQDDIPIMLVKIESDVPVTVSGRMVINEEYESYQDVISRYKNGGQVETMVTPEQEVDIENSDALDSLASEDGLTLDESTNDSKVSSTEDENDKYGGNPIIINNSDND